MQVKLLTAGAMASALLLSGCYTPQQQNTANGAVLGGATGALIGGLASGRCGRRPGGRGSRRSDGRDPRLGRDPEAGSRTRGLWRPAAAACRLRRAAASASLRALRLRSLRQSGLPAVLRLLIPGVSASGLDVDRSRASPNHGARAGARRPDSLVLHYTGMRDGASAVDRLCDPASEVSCHYVVTEAGELLQLVAEDRRAWHAGRSFWQGETDLNSASIGIEVVNGGHDFRIAAVSGGSDRRRDRAVPRSYRQICDPA